MNKINIKLKFLINTKVFISSLLEEIIDHNKSLCNQLVAYEKENGEIDYPDIINLIKKNDVFNEEEEKKKYAHIAYKIMTFESKIDNIRAIVHPFIKELEKKEEYKKLDFLAYKIFTLKTKKCIDKKIEDYKLLLDKEILIDKDIALRAMNHSKIEKIREEILSKINS